MCVTVSALHTLVHGSVEYSGSMHRAYFHTANAMHVCLWRDYSDSTADINRNREFLGNSYSFSWSIDAKNWELSTLVKAIFDLKYK